MGRSRIHSRRVRRLLQSKHDPMRDLSNLNSPKTPNCIVSVIMIIRLMPLGVFQPKSLSRSAAISIIRCSPGIMMATLTSTASRTTSNATRFCCSRFLLLLLLLYCILDSIIHVTVTTAICCRSNCNRMRYRQTELSKPSKPPGTHRAAKPFAPFRSGSSRCPSPSSPLRWGS